MTDEEKNRVLKQFLPFWDKLSDNDAELLVRNTYAHSYAKGGIVHGGGEECTGAVLVISGRLRAYLMSEEGKEVTLYSLYPKDVCMLSASCVLRAITFDVFVEAAQESEVLIIGGSVLSEIAQRNVYAENFALSRAVERFSDVVWAMQQILFMSLDRRLAVFLHDECAAEGGDTVKLTHDEIAKYIGSAREAVSRMLKYFSDEGIVSMSRGGIRITDPAALKRLAF